MSKFEIGEKVYKPSGYEFPSEIRSVFTKRDGTLRVVAEDDRGLLHVFN